MSDYSFPATSSIQITFSHGEQPSPVKLQGAFRYLQSGFMSIESFLGNGQDYNTGTPVTYNNSVSAAIGAMDDVYMPINILGNLSSFYASLGNYNSSGTEGDSNPLKYHYVQNSSNITEYIELSKSRDYVYFPIPKFPTPQTLGSSYTFGIVYWIPGIYANQIYVDFLGRDSDGDITFTNADGTTLSSPYSSISLGSPPGDNSLAHAYVTIPSNGQDLAFIRIYDSNANPSGLQIFSIYLIDNINTVPVSYNKVSLSNSATIRAVNNFTVNIPSVPSMPVNMAYVPSSCTVGINCSHVGVCSARVSDSYCLGNTYDIFAETGTLYNVKEGKVVCHGAPYSYDPDLTTNNIVAQSDLNVTHDPYKIKFAPFLLTSKASVQLDNTKSSLYALTFGGLIGSTAPDKTRVLSALTLQSDAKSLTGTSYVTPTVLGINDPDSWVSRRTTPYNGSEFTIIGGNYGLAQSISAFFMLQSGKTTTTSVYAE